MSIKKNLDPSDKSFTSFTVNKKFSFTERDSGSGIFAVPIISGTDANLYNFLKSTATSKTISGSVFYKTPTYHAINQLYYKDIRSMLGHIDLYRGVPITEDAVQEYMLSLLFLYFHQLLQSRQLLQRASHLLS